MFGHWVLQDISSLVFSCPSFQLRTIQLQVVEKFVLEKFQAGIYRWQVGLVLVSANEVFVKTINLTDIQKCS